MFKRLLLTGVAAAGFILASQKISAISFDLNLETYLGWSDARVAIREYNEKKLQLLEEQKAENFTSPLCFDQSPRKTSSNLAVLLIDMQDGFLENISPKEKQVEISYQDDVLDFCDKNNIPVYVLEYAGQGNTTSTLRTKYQQLGSTRKLIKSHDDGFHETNLAEQLRHSGIERVLLMGINASACVRATAEGALEHSFEIMTSGQLIADPPSWGYGQNVTWFRENGRYYDNYTELLAALNDETCPLTHQLTSFFVTIL